MSRVRPARHDGNARKSALRRRIDQPTVLAPHILPFFRYVVRRRVQHGNEYLARAFPPGQPQNLLQSFVHRLGVSPPPDALSEASTRCCAAMSDVKSELFTLYSSPSSR